MARYGVQGPALKKDASSARFPQPADGRERGGFPRPVGTEDGDDLALFDVYADAVQRFHFAVAHAQIAQFQIGGGLAHTTPLGRPPVPPAAGVARGAHPPPVRFRLGAARRFKICTAPGKQDVPSAASTAPSLPRRGRPR